MAALAAQLDPSATPHSPGRIVAVVNARSGTNARHQEALDQALEIFGSRAERLPWHPEENLQDLVDRAIARGADTILAAGGDGTAMALAQAMLGREAALAVLPLGTFNFFARGLGLSQDPKAAARALLRGKRHRVRVGEVNGQIFLNNASLGVYPAILKKREAIYARWGRHRLMAHWSVLKTFWRFQRPMQMELIADGTAQNVVTPLLFVARSAYQLELFGLSGGEAIKEDRFAVLIGKAGSRFELFRLAWRLVTRRMQQGRDYDLISARALTVRTRKARSLVAFDGEKMRDRSPFEFRMLEQPLTLLLPQEAR